MIKKVVGAAMLSFPFLVVLSYVVSQDGWPMALLVVGVVAAAIACVSGGVYLLS